MHRFVDWYWDTPITIWKFVVAAIVGAIPVVGYFFIPDFFWPWSAQIFTLYVAPTVGYTVIAILVGLLINVIIGLISQGLRGKLD